MKNKNYNLSIILIVIIVFAVIIYFLMNIFFRMNSEKELVKKEAIDYFCEKHNADKSVIKIVDYDYSDGDSILCIWMCFDEGEMTIEYKNKEYDLFYDGEWYENDDEDGQIELDDY